MIGVDTSILRYQCNRCGNTKQSAFAEFYDMYLHQAVTYCRLCTNQTQANTAEQLTVIKKREQQITSFCFALPFALSTPQQHVLFHLRGTMRPGQTILLQAVCGAGKTEIIASLIASALQQGKYVGWAIARKDVVIEITSRLQAYFPMTKTIGLYQQSPDLHQEGQLVVLTTARLYDFYRFFDILIVDENDAYPFSDHSGQQFAAKQAIVPEGITIHISATVLKKQRKDYQCICQLPRRFHGYDLPAIIFQKCRLSTWRQKFLAKAIEQHITKWLAQGFPIFIFVSNKQLGRDFCSLLQRVYGKTKVVFVSSDIVDRTPILADLRADRLAMLVTTTILERGVTYPNLQVLVLDADAALFDAQTLVQIAGRVGRSMQAPEGMVVFCYQKRITSAMRQARSYHAKANQGAIIFL